MNDIALKFTQGILEATFLVPQDGCGRPDSFFYPDKTGRNLFFAGIDVYYRNNQLQTLALQLRKLYLPDLPVDLIVSEIKSFLAQKFAFLELDPFSCGLSSLASAVKPSQQRAFANELAESPLLKPTQKFFLFPLSVLDIVADFKSDNFVLLAPSSLDSKYLGNAHIIQPYFFPPIESKFRIQHVTGWLGVYATSDRAAERIKEAVLGAVSLRVTDRKRYMFSGRDIVSGKARFDVHQHTFSFVEQHSPRVFHNIEINEDDSSWLDILSSLISSRKSSEMNRQFNALRYLHRAWRLSPDERFSVHFMALDTLTKKSGLGHSQAICEIVSAHEAVGVDSVQMNDLLQLRSDVVHGRSPDIDDYRNYHKYYKDYGSDPLLDIQRITSHCIRTRIFGNSMSERDGHNAQKCPGCTG